MDTVTGFEGTGPVGRIDVFVFWARWGNEARTSGQLTAFSGQLDPSLTVGVLIGLRNEASRSFTVAVLFLRNEATVLL